MAETPDTLKQEIKLFYCYAREDKALRDELQVHLSGLRRLYQLTNWHDREILPGEQWEKAIDKHLSTADVILVLISPHFLDSDYCYGKEMQRALERHHAGNCCVIPILLHPTYWEETPFSSIQMLPTDARPITSWLNRYEAFHDVARGVGMAIKAMLIPHSQKNRYDCLNEGSALARLNRYEEALAAYEQALRLDPNDTLAYYSKGTTLARLNRYEEALAAYEQIIRLDPNDALAYYSKGSALRHLKRYGEALITYEQIIRLDPNNTLAYYSKGDTLTDLKQYEEALTAYEQIIRLDPNDTLAYAKIGSTLHISKRYEEALAAYEQIIRLDPNDTIAYRSKGSALRHLKRYEEALTTYEQIIHLDSNDTLAHRSRGYVLQMLGRKKEAQQAFEKASQLSNNG